MSTKDYGTHSSSSPNPQMNGDRTAHITNSSDHITTHSYIRGDIPLCCVHQTYDCNPELHHEKSTHCKSFTLSAALVEAQGQNNHADNNNMPLAPAEGT
ncbi:hypothetical protein SCLCIDRAFT_26757 [Scleroderma citrinum Foug A]|uniref:Uncharacterized protein n=1 Tax=Scleroderma citrinum Foug A TaxID=1036808 RepID=A0A0C3DWH7_9AGAM|nr:hypothetical protein SCLCIDRAFT_26757 [Scleroderma citrinum Foug A]